MEQRHTGNEPAGLDEVREVVAHVSELCRRLDPDVLPLAAVPSVFEELSRLHKLASGALTRITPRYEVAITGKPGVKNPTEEAARRTGTSVGAARRRRDTARRAAAHPHLDRGLRDGSLSSDQADTIGEAGLPDDDVSDLIRRAPNLTKRDLTDEVARLRAKYEDEHARAQRIHRKRRLRRWNSPDGAFNLHLVGPAAWGAEIQARLQPLVDEAWQRARRAGAEEPREAYEADALVHLVTNGADPAPRSQAVRPERKVIATVDVDALNRGSCQGDETCEIAGVGPVPVEDVRRMFADAFLTVVFRDAVDIRSVVHLGRQVTAHQRTALEARGYACAGCGSPHRLEIEHVTGWSLTHETTVDDLEWLCSHCHQLKTTGVWRWVGEPGSRRLVPTTESASHAGGDPPPPPPPRSSHGRGGSDPPPMAGGGQAAECHRSASSPGKVRGTVQDALFAEAT